MRTSGSHLWLVAALSSGVVACTTLSGSNDAGTGTDGGGAVCAADGERCDGANPCCAGLVCALGRVCMASTAPDGGGVSVDAPGTDVPITTDGGGGDTGTMPADGGPMSDSGSTTTDGGGADGGGACGALRDACDVVPCCAGLTCRPTNSGMQCRM